MHLHHFKTTPFPNSHKLVIALYLVHFFYKEFGHFTIMNHQEEQELLSQSTLPVLSRLDRLDRLVSDFFFFFCVCMCESLQKLGSMVFKQNYLTG